MDENRKRYLTLGMILGALVVGLAVLWRRTPPEKRAGTLTRIGRDALSFFKVRFGANDPTIALAERALDRIEEAAANGGDDGAPAVTVR
jgi:hypothetical protein